MVFIYKKLALIKKCLILIFGKKGLAKSKNKDFDRKKCDLDRESLGGSKKWHKKLKSAPISRKRFDVVLESVGVIEKISGLIRQ